VRKYQHDLSEHKLSRSLDAVVEDCVNAVGVDVNTASTPLLSQVSCSLHRRIYCEPDFPPWRLSCTYQSEGPLVMTAGHEFYKKLTCPKAEHVVRSVDGGEAHCKIEFDWLDGVFK
jgi:hypothetical protein